MVEILLGESGTGKTHLAEALGLATIYAGARVLTAALLDRLTHHSHILIVEESYRFRESKKRRERPASK